MIQRALQSTRWAWDQWHDALLHSQSRSSLSSQHAPRSSWCRCRNSHAPNVLKRCCFETSPILQPFRKSALLGCQDWPLHRPRAISLRAVIPVDPQGVTPAGALISADIGQDSVWDSPKQGQRISTHSPNPVVDRAENFRRQSSSGRLSLCLPTRSAFERPRSDARMRVPRVVGSLSTLPIPTLSRAAFREASRSAFDAWASGFSQYCRLNTHDQRINLHRDRYQRRLDPNSAQTPSGQTRALQCPTIYSLANCPGKPACELLSFGHCRAPSH